MRTLLRPIGRRWEDLNFGRDVVREWACELGPHTAQTVRILDAGVGSGADLLACAAALAPRPARLHGLDWSSDSLAQLDPRIASSTVDIERETWPFEDASASRSPPVMTS